MAVLVLCEPATGATGAGWAAALEVVGQALLDAAGIGARELSLVITTDAEIRALNAEWRHEDKATDVLSFPLDDGAPAPGSPADSPLGDIVISVDTTARQAAELGWDGLRMARFLLVHGFCHLLGHDHGEPAEAEAMRAEEDRLLAAVAPDDTRPPTPY